MAWCSWISRTTGSCTRSPSPTSPRPAAPPPATRSPWKPRKTNSACSQPPTTAKTQAAPKSWSTNRHSADSAGSADDSGGDVVEMAEGQERGAVDQLQRFAGGELVAAGAEAAGGDEDALGGAGVDDGAEEVADGRRWDGAGPELGLYDELATGDRPRIVSHAVDPAVTAAAEQPRLQAHSGEQVLHEMLEGFGSQLQEIGPAVDLAQYVDRLDGPRIREIELQHGLDRLQLLRMPRHLRGEVVPHARDGIQLVQHQGLELVPRRPQRDQARPHCLPGRQVHRLDHAVEHHRVHHAVPITAEDQVQGPQRQLCNELLIQEPQLLRWPGYGDDRVPRAVVPVRRLSRYDAHIRQIPLDHQQRRLRHVHDPSPAREVEWLRHAVQCLLEIPADRRPVPVLDGPLVHVDPGVLL